MTVAIDTSEIRRAPAAPTWRKNRTLRAIILGGVGGAGLVAFTWGAFWFFSDLADPRVRTVRHSRVAAKWPDLKDGIPSLASDTLASAPVLNLPRPPAEPQQTASLDKAASPVDPTPAPAPSPLPVAASVPAARPAPPIQNVSVVAEAKPAKLVVPTQSAALLAPTKAETVRARTGEPTAFVSLPAKPASTPDQASPATASMAAHADPVAADPGKPAAASHRESAKAASPKPTKAAPPKAVAVNASPAKTTPDKNAPDKATPAKVAVAKPKPVVEATARPVAAQSADESDEPEVLGVRIPGARQISNGVKAIGSIFSGDPEAN